MYIAYSFKLCNNFEKIPLKKAISCDKNTLYICKAGKTKAKTKDGKTKEKQKAVIKVTA